MRTATTKRLARLYQSGIVNVAIAPATSCININEKSLGTIKPMSNKPIKNTKKASRVSKKVFRSNGTIHRGTKYTKLMLFAMANLMAATMIKTVENTKTSLVLFS